PARRPAGARAGTAASGGRELRPAVGLESLGAAARRGFEPPRRRGAGRPAGGARLPPHPRLSVGQQPELARAGLGGVRHRRRRTRRTDATLWPARRAVVAPRRSRAPAHAGAAARAARARGDRLARIGAPVAVAARAA